MICRHAPSGCNYPEGECVGLCADDTNFPRKEVLDRREDARRQIERLLAERDELLRVLTMVHEEVRPHGHKPYSGDSYLPAHIVEALRVALERVRDARI